MIDVIVIDVIVIDVIVIDGLFVVDGACVDIADRCCDSRGVIDEGV